MKHEKCFCVCQRYYIYYSSHRVGTILIFSTPGSKGIVTESQLLKY